jgi:hypothetical protein
MPANVVRDRVRFVHEVPPSHAALVLVARAPAVKAGVGQIVLQLHDRAIADLDVQLCGVDQRGVIEQVRVDESYR